MRAVLLPEGLQRAQLLFESLVRRRSESELGISPAQPRKDAVIHLDLCHHRAAKLRSLARIGGHHARRQPCKLVRTHAQRAGSVDRRRIAVQLCKGREVQPDQSDDEDKESNECNSQFIMD